MPPRAWRCAPRGPAPARPAAGRRSSVERHPGGVVEHQAAGGREPAGQHRHPDRVAHPQSTPGMRESHDAGHDADAGAVHLGLGDPVRDEVVEQHHALGQGHRPRRPGHHARRQVRRDVEQVQHPGELADVPAGDRQRRRPLEEVLDLLAMAGHRRSLLRAPGVVERLLELSHPLQVLFVQQLHDAQRVGQRPLAQPGPRIGTAGDLVRRTERMVELHEVELAQLGQGSLVLALGMGVLPVLLVAPPGSARAGRGSRSGAPPARAARRRRPRVPATPRSRWPPRPPDRGPRGPAAGSRAAGDPAA